MPHLAHMSGLFALAAKHFARKISP
jgi:hypothetical protein